MKQVKDTLTLQCTLTDAEKLVYSQEMSEEVVKCSEAEGELKSMSQQMKATIQEHTAHINVLANKINTGREMRPVECEVHYDYDRKIKSWIRKDTGEIAREREMSEEDLQAELQLEGDGK